jgi:drug/metabolite transporter (DMT)-like permease
LASEKGYGTAAAITVSIIWGLSFVAASMVLTTLSPVILATVRFIIAAAIYSSVTV